MKCRRATTMSDITAVAVEADRWVRKSLGWVNGDLNPKNQDKPLER